MRPGFEARRRARGENTPPEASSRRIGPPYGRILAVTLVAAGSVAALAGWRSVREHPDSEVAAVATAPSSTTPASAVATAPVDASCGTLPASDVDGLRKVANVVETSRFEGSVNRLAYPFLGSALRVGAFRGPAEITKVERIEQTPLNLLPGEAGEAPSNSAAGLSAHWAGVQVTVGSEPTARVVRIPLAVGGPDVVAADMAATDLTAFDALVGSCAILFEDERAEAGALFGTTTSIVAVATSAGDPPVVIDGQFRVVRDLPSALEGIMTTTPS